MNGLVFNMVGGVGGGVKLVSIAITTPPAKTTYVSGETFNPAGMVVTATYSNGATLKATITDNIAIKMNKPEKTPI